MRKNLSKPLDILEKLKKFDLLKKQENILGYQAHMANDDHLENNGRMYLWFAMTIKRARARLRRGASFILQDGPALVADGQGVCVWWIGWYFFCHDLSMSMAVWKPRNRQKSKNLFRSIKTADPITF